MLAARVTLLRTLGAAAAATLTLAGGAFGAAMDLQLTFGSLPSAQGWSYAAVGSHAGVPEANIFSVGGGVLTQNSMGQSNGVAGGSILYNYLSGVTNTETKQVRVRARCLAVEGSTNAPIGQGGFYFGFTANSTNYGFSLTPTKVTILISTGHFVFAGSYDNSTFFHEYMLEFTPPTTTRVYRDGVLLGTSTAGFPAALSNRVSLGDGTGGANARGEITLFRFVQDVATDVRTTTWGRLKALYR